MKKIDLRISNIPKYGLLMGPQAFRVYCFISKIIEKMLECKSIHRANLIWEGRIKEPRDTVRDSYLRSKGIHVRKGNWN